MFTMTLLADEEAEAKLVVSQQVLLTASNDPWGPLGFPPPPATAMSQTRRTPSYPSLLAPSLKVTTPFIPQTF